VRLGPEESRPPTQLRFHPFAPRLAACSIHGLYVRIWDLGTGSITNLLFHSAQTLSLTWHPDGEILAGGSTNGAICLWNVNTGQPSPMSQGASTWSVNGTPPSQRPWKVLDGHEAEVLRLAFTHSGNLLASFGADKALCLWSIATGRKMTHSPESADIEALAFSTDDRRLGLYRSDSELQIWEVNTAAAYRPLLDPAGASDEITQIDFSPNSDTLAVATSRGTVLWDGVTGRRLGTLASAPVRSVFFDRRSGDLLTCSGEGLRRFLLDNSATAGAPQLCPKSHVNISTNLNLPENLGKMALSHDGKTVAILVSQSLVIFNPSLSEQPKQLALGTFCDAVALSPDGTFVAVRERGKDEIQFWDTKQQSRISGPVVIKAGPNFCFSPDGKWFCAITGGEYVAWQIPGWTKGPRLARKRSANQPGVVAFSPDSSTLAIGIAPSAIQLVQMPGGAVIATLENPDRQPVVNLAFSRDGRRLAAAAREELVVLWDLAVVAEELSELGLRGDLPAFLERPPKASSGASIEMSERKFL
jgi:WD40 repeat protein